MLQLYHGALAAQGANAYDAAWFPHWGSARCSTKSRRALRRATQRQASAKRVAEVERPSFTSRHTVQVELVGTRISGLRSARAGARLAACARDRRG
jgi:hypothetical protein